MNQIEIKTKFRFYFEFIPNLRLIQIKIFGSLPFEEADLILKILYKLSHY